jgi:hypothetical protein
MLIMAFALMLASGFTGRLHAQTTISAAGLYDISGFPGPTVTVEVDGVALTGAQLITVLIKNGVTLTLKNAEINGGIRVETGAAPCKLVLVGSNYARGAQDCAGVNVPAGASLTIEGPGSLTALGSVYCAGIGGNRNELNGAITIQHAVVTANGGSGGGAGIGSGTSNSGSTSPITIINSAVTARGGGGISVSYGGGAGIGGGGGSSVSADGGRGENITISYASVKATGGNGLNYTIGGGGGGGAGIGGGGGGGDFGGPYGSGGNGNNITITGSSVEVKGGRSMDGSGGVGGSGGAGIGGGGGGGGGSGSYGGLGGTASGITLDGPLADGSDGGAGGTGTAGNGGKGALCGNGGSYLGSGIEFTLADGSIASNSGPTVDLSDHPKPSFSGSPAFPPLPSVTINPASPTVTDGGNITFTATAVSGTPLTGATAYYYRWQVSANNGTAWTDIADDAFYSGAETDALTLTGAALTDNGKQFRCIVNDAVWREAVSNTVTLTVVLSTDATLASVAGQAVTAGTEQGTDTAPKTATLTVPATKTAIGRSDIIPAHAGATFNLYSDAGFATEITGTGTIALTPAGPTLICVKVTAQDGTTTLHYLITVNVAPVPPVTTVPPRITGPASLTLTKGYPATSTGDYTVTGTAPVTVTKLSGDDRIAWNGSTRQLDIAAGLDAGNYEVRLRASNSAGTATFVFLLKVVEKVYYLDIPRSIPGGTVTTATRSDNPFLAIEGETVMLTLTPDAGFELASILVYRYGTATPVPLTGSGPAYSFVMPAGHVSIAVTFRATGTGVEDVQAAQLKAYVEHGALYVSGLPVGADWKVYNILGSLIYQGKTLTGFQTLSGLPLPGRGVYIVTDGKTVLKVSN